MQFKAKIFMLVALILLAIITSLFFFGGDLKSVFTGKSQKQDTLNIAETLNPEIAELSLKIKETPNQAELYLNRADAYMAHGNLKFALLDYKKSYSLDSVKQAYAMGLADCYFEVNYPDSAIYILEQFLKHEPENIDVLFDVALDYFLLPSPKYQIALDRLNTILKKDIQYSDAYFYKGLIYKETGDTAKAISNFQTAIETNPDHYDAYMQLGLLYAVQKNPLAVKYFDNAILINDSSNEAKYARAKFMQDNGQMKDAIEYYKNIIIKNPQDADAIYNLAAIYYGIDSMEKSYRMFDLAIKQDPAKKEAYFGKGLSAEGLGKTEEAISYYKQALNLDPNYTDAENQLNQLNAKQK